MTPLLGEVISGQEAIDLIHSLIASRRLCKIKIPNTHYCWITLICDLREEGPAKCLLLDGIAGFERFIARSKDGEVSIEFTEAGGVHSHFTTRVLKCFPKVIRVECPAIIHRMQRRVFYRLKAQGGTEIVFHVEPEKEERAKVRDYSQGGTAFFVSRPLNLKPGDPLKDIQLRIPQEKGWFVVPIPLSVVRRVDPPAENRNYVYALEFLEMSEATRELLARHIFEKQRALLRKLGKDLP